MENKEQKNYIITGGQLEFLEQKLQGLSNISYHIRRICKDSDDKTSLLKVGFELSQIHSEFYEHYNELLDFMSKIKQPESVVD